jgi:hypothetical protein
MDVPVIEVGGTHVNILATGQARRLEFESGPTPGPRTMVAAVRRNLLRGGIDRGED